MYIYISGPISGDPEYRNNFFAAEQKIKDLGHIPMNPARMAEIAPGLRYEQYLDLDMELLKICDAIYLMPGWEGSKGANREYGYALGSGMKVIKSLEDLDGR